MTLKDSFFFIESAEAGSPQPTFTIRLNAEHYIFKAHFPDNPIVPGVCQTQIVAELLELMLGRAVYMSEAANIKFLSVITPRETPRLCVAFDKIMKDDDGVGVKVAFSSDGKPYSKLSLRFCYNPI